MVEKPMDGTASTSAAANRRSVAPASLVSSSRFKYYIHDGVESFRLQLIGDLCATNVSDLTGCWNTARTTLGSRKLILDLNALAKTDEAGHEWLLSMIREGASSTPESYFRDRLAVKANTASAGNTIPSGKFGRIASFFRGSRDLDVDGFAEASRARRSRS